MDVGVVPKHRPFQKGRAISAKLTREHQSEAMLMRVMRVAEILLEGQPETIERPPVKDRKSV